MRYNRRLRDLIIRGQASPSQIVSHELYLEEAVRAYDQFDKRADGWTRVILHPARMADRHPVIPSYWEMYFRRSIAGSACGIRAELRPAWASRGLRMASAGS